MSASTQIAMTLGQKTAFDALYLLDDKVLTMIIGQNPLGRTLEALCREIEKQHAGLLCSVILLDQDGVTMRSSAAPSLPQAYCRAIDGVKAGPCAGSCGTAIYRKQAVVVSDIGSDPLWVDCRDLALSHQLRACWSTPIASQDGNVLGTFAIYYREPRTPDAQHLQLIAHATHLAALAIERDRDQTQLRVAENRYRTLVERLPAITYVAELGAGGPWHYVSPQIQTILGFSPEEWLKDPWNWMHHIHLEDREIAYAAEEDFQENRKLFKAEYRMLAADGRVLWFRDEGVMLHAREDQPLLMQGVLYDITEHKRLEEQLRHSQKMEAVGQLAGGVAHDFNNLLMLIQAQNERLRGRLHADDPAYADTLEIEHAVKQAAWLTNRLLAFSRRQLLQLQVLDLNLVLADTAKMLERLISPDIELSVVSGATPQWVKADSGQLSQVILNLAVNARDAMPEGGTLAISIKAVELKEPQAAVQGAIPPGAYAVLAVKDTGTGMDADVQEHIFEPFFTTKQPGKGTGLGLAIVYGVVKQTGGWVTVRSRPDQGTTFEIYIPRAEESTEDTIPKQKGIVDYEGPQAGRGSETILLVEDQQGIREVVQEFLNRRGYSVLCAADGDDALQIASDHTHAIDLLVTDVIMPNMGGPELVQRLIQTRPHTKVLFISGNPDQASLNERLGTEAVVLQKPFALDILLRKVRSVLDE
jgi:two-component system, cell cycle sensor histidine kinase and response regulator CckA